MRVAETRSLSVSLDNVRLTRVYHAEAANRSSIPLPESFAGIYYAHIKSPTYLTSTLELGAALL